MTRPIRTATLIATINCLMLTGTLLCGALGAHFHPILWAILCLQPLAILASIYAIRRSLAGLTSHAPPDPNARQHRRFIDDIAHGLRTSLAVLQLQADLHDKIETKKLQPHLRDMAQLIAQYLALARVEQAKEPASAVVRD